MQHQNLIDQSRLIHYRTAKTKRQQQCLVQHQQEDDEKHTKM